MSAGSDTRPVADFDGRHFDGSRYEDLAGYARAARRGPHIAVSGTIDQDAETRPTDTHAQVRAAFETALAAVRALGGETQDVIRTRIYLAPGADWLEASRAHAALFADVRPANTTIIAHGFIAANALVEVEIDAYLAHDQHRQNH